MVEHVPFKLNSEFEPQGDQPQAIQKIVDGVNNVPIHLLLVTTLNNTTNIQGKKAAHAYQIIIVTHFFCLRLS